MVAAVSELEASINKTVLLFNRLKSPEAVAKVAFFSPERCAIVFSGSFCYDCGGVQVYIEDFAKDFRVFSGSYVLEVGRTKQINPRSVEVDYRIKTK